MYNFIKTYQLDIMMILCGVSMTMALLLFITEFLPRRRKWSLISMELVATCLLFFDRLAYIYSGNVTTTGFFMVRVSNFMVFLMTPAVVLTFGFCLIDTLNKNHEIEVVPKRLLLVATASLIGMMLAIISQFTGLYYYFDENNIYHRGPGFLICYFIPIVGPIIQYTVIVQYRKRFSKFLYIAFSLYIILPILAAIIQIFAYGISIVNMAMVFVSISLYIFTYLDINDEVIRAHNIELEIIEEEKKSTKRLFDQTANAFVKAVEKKDEYSKGNSAKKAEIARAIARETGKNEDECEEVYYAALLQDVGRIGLPDSVIGKTGALNSFEEKLLRQEPVLSGEILSIITEYPYLSIGARYSCESYDGTGYPEGLQGENIPDIARIIAVADAYVDMSTNKINRNPIPEPMIREDFVKNAGIKFDPVYANIMVKLIDSNVFKIVPEAEDELVTELECKTYRDNFTKGIEVTDFVKNITFFSIKGKEDNQFSQPSIVLFDSFDRHVHADEMSISAYRYTEYGELWFDGHSISTSVRNMQVTVSDIESNQSLLNVFKDAEKVESRYRISACRYEDHVKIIMENKGKIVETIIALPDKTKSVYISLTGENCFISSINVEETEIQIKENDIERIEEEIDFKDRLESDVPNVQIDRTRSDATDGIEINDDLSVYFHSMTLPSGSFIWHCPYIVLFYSKDKKVFGEGYKEYAMIKINGEDDGSKEDADNMFFMEKEKDFKDWDFFKHACKQGIECRVDFKRKGNRIIMNTENLGIKISNTTILHEGNDDVYVAITGDQVALTDIRVKS